MVRKQPGPGFLILLGVLKVLAIFVGGLLTVVALMSLVGLLFENGWLRLGVALVVAIGVPGVIADRLLPDDPTKGKGVLTDVFALAWLGFALLFVGAAIPLTRPVLRAEADRHATSGWDTLADGTFWLAGTDESATVAVMPGTTAPTSAEAATASAAATTAAPVGEAPGSSSGSKADAGRASHDAGTVAPALPGSGDEPPSEDHPEMTPAEIFKEWAPSVVTVKVRGAMGGVGGTGFIIDADGTIVTNHHVVEHAKDVAVKLMDGTYADEVELLLADEKADLALLRITTRAELEPVVLGDSEEVTVGERAISIGNPLGLEHTLTDGLVSARRVIRGQRMIQMSTPISPGNSGGPLFNLRAEVIGVSTATMSAFGPAQNLNLAVPINALKLLISDTDDYPDRKRIGGGTPEESGRW